MKIKEADVFSIKTQIGFGFIQFIKKFENGIELIRILEPIKGTQHIEQSEVDLMERFNTQFSVQVAYNKKLISKIGEFKIPSTYRTPKYTRSKHQIRGEFLGWHIINVQTLQRELKKQLSDDELLLSPHGIMNDTLLIDYLENNWRLNTWT